MKKVSIVSVGTLPVPASNGGAVENIIENIVRENEIQKKLELVVFSCYDQKSYELSKHYEFTKFEFVKIPRVIVILDKLIYRICGMMMSGTNLAFRYLLQRLYFIFIVSIRLRKSDFGNIILENHYTLYIVMLLWGNSRKYKNRYYYHMHNVMKTPWYLKEVIKKSNKFIGVSKYINSTLISKGIVSESKFSVLKNKIDRDCFNIELKAIERSKLRKKYQIPNENKIILFTGRLTKDKGILELLKAFKMLKDEKVSLLIVGSYFFKSDVASPFEKEISRLIDNRVIFSGYVDYEEIPVLYNLSDFVVLPSIWNDPAPLTVIEALTSGKPLITTNMGGIKEYADDETSIIVDYNSNFIENLLIAIEKLLNNEEMTKELSKKAKEKTEFWTTSNYYNEFVDEIA
ncbi:TPA: glycosyltransferase family 4 protein [Streptococcus suis]